MKKKIVILSAFLTPFRSGAEACAEEVSARLKDDFDITIITARLRKDLPYLDHLPSGVRVWRVGFGTSFDKWLFPFLAPRAAKALKPDIIHAILETFAGMAMMQCASIPARRILTLQTTNRTFLKGPIIRGADTVTAISSALVTIAKGHDRDAILIPNGIDLKLLQEARGKHPKLDGRVLFVGRLEPMKGVDTLLKAISDKRLAISGAHLRIVGDGSQRTSLEALSHELGLSDRVTFAGRVEPQRVAAEYAQASIFCGLSRSEALGNVFLEAQAAGCAVIGTKVGGIPDIVKDGETGLLVEPDNVEAAAAAIERLLTDEALRSKLAAAGEKHAKAYDWNSIAERYKAVYQQH